jgi:hypothetical protein
MMMKRQGEIARGGKREEEREGWRSTTNITGLEFELNGNKTQAHESMPKDGVRKNTYLLLQIYRMYLYLPPTTY